MARLVPVINQWYGHFRINISDTGNDFSSIFRGLINIVRHYSTFREIETRGTTGILHGAEIKKKKKIKFALYNHISIAMLNIPPLKTFTCVEVSTAHSLKHRFTANM